MDGNKRGHHLCRILLRLGPGGIADLWCHVAMEEVKTMTDTEKAEEIVKQIHKNWPAEVSRAIKHNSKYPNDPIFPNLDRIYIERFTQSLTYTRQKVAAQMQELLERYGQHDEYDCEAEYQRRSCYTKPTDPKKSCTCGFEQALALADGRTKGAG